MCWRTHQMPITGRGTRCTSAASQTICLSLAPTPPLLTSMAPNGYCRTLTLAAIPRVSVHHQSQGSTWTSNMMGGMNGGLWSPTPAPHSSVTATQPLMSPVMKGTGPSICCQLVKNLKSFL
ncbi:hypothetical protein E2C01_037421 [Portunus trituberculatus]|uniref:Uncharacterized protein n=1 Tax=Portunus trituberculatus TaxID=210409 RepID=A0A5B7FEX2_PORTR|nr:hypothetical protein [Portunus trituberculatus]